MCFEGYVLIFKYVTPIFICMYCMYVCVYVLYVCVHVLYVCVHVLYVCVHVLYVCVHVLYVCVHVLYVLYVCVHVLYVCVHVLYVFMWRLWYQLSKHLCLMIYKMFLASIIIYSRTSVIRTSINRLLGLSGLEGRILLLTPIVSLVHVRVHSEVMASSSGSARKRKRLVLPLESKIAILERLV